MRRLLIFLSEKLAKETNATMGSGNQNENELGSKSKHNQKAQMAQKIKNQMNQFWLAPNCKLNGLRIQENDSLEKEVI